MLNDNLEPSQISVRTENNVCWLKLVGEADIEFVNMFSKVAQDIEKKAGNTILVINLEDVTYIDSASLTVFIRLIKIFKKQDKALYLYRPIPEIAQLFETTGLNRLVKTIESDKEIKPPKKRTVKKKTKKKTGKKQS